MDFFHITHMHTITSMIKVLIFWDLGTCRSEMTGIGNKIRRKSEIMFSTATATRIAGRLIH